MLQLIYASRPFGYDLNMLASILATSRERNARADITGALICRFDIFLQLLEGPKAQVESTFERICADDRHVDVLPLVSEPVEDRLFPQWAMKHDPAVSWLWSPLEIHMGALENASVRDIRAIFLKVAMADGS
ncbi:BLUF domain-containing protein [uncultured Roseobacter sp.]|uniref:BLUF domain-containing protein n=1 Tax=uncultured Roseobacter sp. TaxID=114847 RepID=UPI00262DBF9A|nr:BLUF domain-containing protein [uncultured Roseobacter sp.]